jgi:hypothetical protein
MPWPKAIRSLVDGAGEISLLQLLAAPDWAIEGGSVPIDG